MLRSLICRVSLIAIVIMTALAVWKPNVSAHSWMAPRHESEKQNPIPGNRETIGKGRAVFEAFCAHCHGTQAGGMSAKSAGLKKDAPNLVQRLATHTHGDFFWKIRTGKGEMPSFAEDLSEDETWAVIRFIESLHAE